jgi:SRSO17 transposase
VSYFSRSWTSNPVRLATKGRLKARFVAVRVRIADGPQQRIKDRGQQHLPGEEARLIGEHRNSGRSMKFGGTAAETNSIVNPREENCTAERSGYLDRCPIGGCASAGGW